MKVRMTAGVIALGLLVAVVLLRPGKDLSLTASGTVLVFETQSAAMAVPAPSAIAQLADRQSVPVERCVDVKHYQIYEVRLPDGRHGFVNAGDYALMRGDEAAVC